MGTTIQPPRWNVELMHADMTLKGWLRTDLAKRAKVDNMTVIRFFTGFRQTARQAKKIARALGHPLDRYYMSTVFAADNTQEIA